MLKSHKFNKFTLAKPPLFTHTLVYLKALSYLIIDQIGSVRVTWPAKAKLMGKNKLFVLSNFVISYTYYINYNPLIPTEQLSMNGTIRKLQKMQVLL